MSRTYNPDVPELVDDAVGGDASRQLGRFTLSVSSNEDTDMNEIDVGGEINFHGNAANGSSVLEFSVENFANNPSGDGSSHGFGIDRGHLSSSFDRTPTESVELMMDSANNLKQIGLAVIHYDGSPSPVESDYSSAYAFDAGECSVDICARNSPQASLAPVKPRGYAGGHFELVVEVIARRIFRQAKVNPGTDCSSAT